MLQVYAWPLCSSTSQLQENITGFLRTQERRDIRVTIYSVAWLLLYTCFSSLETSIIICNFSPPPLRFFPLCLLSASNVFFSLYLLPSSRYRPSPSISLFFLSSSSSTFIFFLFPSYSLLPFFFVFFFSSSLPFIYFLLPFPFSAPFQSSNSIEATQHRPRHQSLSLQSNLRHSNNLPARRVSDRRINSLLQTASTVILMREGCSESVCVCVRRFNPLCISLKCPANIFSH